jgi:hypothetical protein|nr:hypothetical protein [uncultured Acetatifactor sp.]
MGVIADYWNGPCHITVHDDAIRPPEEVEQIIYRVSRLVYQEDFRRYLQEKQKRQAESKEAGQ